MRYLWLFICCWINSVMATDLGLFSSSFKNGNNIPKNYTCEGQNKSPPFTWVNAPPDTKSFVLIAEDPGAPTGTWYHWILVNIPANVRDISENQIPANSAMIKNSWKKKEYDGPCPPPGQMHHYFFTLYALNTTINLDTPIPIEVSEVQGIIATHTVGMARVMGTYRR